MRTFNRFRVYLWNIDPGYFNLKQALKTVLAIVISVWIVRDEGMLTSMLAGIAGGIAVQGVVAETWILKLFHVVIFDLIYFTVFAIGLMVRDSTGWTALTLVVLGFLANYIRRFGLENSMAPMMGWTLCFLATILPFSSASEAWTHLYGLFVGFGVSAIIILFIFPENYPRLFVKNSNRFFQTLSSGMADVRRCLLLSGRKMLYFTDLPSTSIKKTLMQLVNTNQAIQFRSKITSEEKQLSHIVLHQYALMHAYILLMDAYHALEVQQHKMSRPSQLAVSMACKQFVKLLSRIQVHADFTVSVDSSFYGFPELAKKLGRVPSVDPSIIMLLLNIKLSFELMSQHISKLAQNADET
ncbi:hypothetical protein [Legionella nagasakiensis]|uniref:hypothetical protein n=1 Tax=Legionella nagasakiensis TaxID=535290 RepID=UPI001056171E|nr:hypothetical protein [Legionella nagasakiensis]